MCEYMLGLSARQAQALEGDGLRRERNLDVQADKSKNVIDMRKARDVSERVEGRIAQRRVRELS